MCRSEARDSFAGDLQRFASYCNCRILFAGIVGILGEFYRLLQSFTFLVVGMFVGTTVDCYLRRGWGCFVGTRS
ncbi:hypothetical protein [Proteus phage RP7]|nr:hypothetical protein [Proteus phage RP7]